MRVHFLGAAETVTGSKFLVQDENTQILVDCGMFQGLKELREMNWLEFDFHVSQIDAVILTHAHLDHCGALPILVREGFKGPIFCTEPTAALTRLILLDSAKIQEEDAEYANKKGFSKHSPALPLYTVEDAEKVLEHFVTVDLKEEFQIGTLQARLFMAGHILGAASAWISNGKKSVYFSGDLGRYEDPLMPPPEAPQGVDMLVMESTYGHKNHSAVSSKEVLKEEILAVAKDRGVLLIPSFSVGRSQNILYEIVELKRNGEIPATVPVYFNSPMGSDACALYEKYYPFHKLGRGQFAELMSEIHSVKTSEASKDLNQSQQRPMVIIAASGMLTGGRVLHHLKAFGGYAKNRILLAGFQSPGTRGRDLLEGKREIKIHGQFHEIKSKIIPADSFSAHADQSELLKWIQSAKEAPKKVFLVHGELNAAKELAQKIESELGLSVEIPKMGRSFDV